MKRISKCQLWRLLKGYWASSNLVERWPSRLVATAAENRLSFRHNLGCFRMLARRDGAGVRLLTRRGHNLLLTSVAALLMATSAAHARPELSKTESWKLTLGTWCVGDHPNDNEAYVGIARDQCGENEAILVIGENGYTWEREEGLSCRYSSGKARFDNT